MVSSSIFYHLQLSIFRLAYKAFVYMDDKSHAAGGNVAPPNSSGDLSLGIKQACSLFL